MAPGGLAQLRDGKLCWQTMSYAAEFDAPAWRAQLMGTAGIAVEV